MAACSINAPAPTKDASTGSLLPNPPGYSVTNVTDVQDLITKIGQLTSLGAGQVEVTAALSALSGTTKCLQNAGAIEARTYLNTSDLSKLGAVIIVNGNAITSPDLILHCTIGNAAPKMNVAIQVCSKTCTITQDNNKFYVAYVGSAPAVCSDFDASLSQCK
jgi:hypothetical protein